MNRIELIRKYCVYGIYILLICCFQVSFPDKLSFHNQIADLMFVFVVIVSYFFGLRDGICVALLVGIIRDCFCAPATLNFDGSTSTTIGIGALVMFLVSVFAASFLTRRMHRRVSFSVITMILSTLLYKLVGHFVIFAWSTFFSGTTYKLSLYQIFIDSTLTQIVLNLLCSVPLYLLLRFVGPYRKGINPILIDNIDLGGKQSWLTI